MLVHKHFEMGTAPYAFIGVYSLPSLSLAEANPTAYNNALAGKPEFCHCSCDHCGMPIMHHYIIKDATGKKFAVGSECINKVGDVSNMSQVEFAKKEHQKALRKARAEAKRQQRHAQYLFELSLQRAKNGGLTDSELADQRREEEARKRAEINENKFEYFISNLGLGGDFAGDLARGMRNNGSLPTGRGLTIMLEIIAKKAGRKNSKAYFSKYAEAETKLEELL